MKFNEAIKIIENIASPKWGADWDNSGIQINVGNDDIKSIMFCLEINDEVIDEAIEKSVDLVVTHHPLLFNKPSRVDVNEITGRYLIKLIKSGISVYSAHITFDNAPLGNNYYMAKLLKLEDATEIEDEIGMIGNLPSEMDFREFFNHVKNSLDLPEHYIKAVGRDNLIIEKVALCTGAGGNLLYRAYQMGCQALVTGDVKLNIAQDAKALGMALIDAGHYGTEKAFSENFMLQFKEILDEMGICDVELNVACANTNPYCIW